MAKKAKEKVQADEMNVKTTAGPGFFHPNEAEVMACGRDKRHKIRPGEYYTKDGEGNPVCRDDIPFDIISAG